MGSSGEKRKGRRHLPKVGTPEAARWEQHEERAAVLGNLGIHEHSGSAAGSAWRWIGIALVVMVVVIGLVAWIALTA